MRSGFEYFRNFEQDAKDFAGFAKTALHMPMLVLSGEMACADSFPGPAAGAAELTPAERNQVAWDSGL